jgi:hypothetical protein
LIPIGATFGPAIGDNSGDDAPAINNALTLALNAGGGAVMLPAGTFKCDSTLIIGGSGVHLIGVGKDATVIQQGSAAGPGYQAVVEVIKSGHHNSIQHLTVKGTGEDSDLSPPGPITALPVYPSDPNLGSGWGILCAGVTETRIEDVRVTQTFNGIGAIVFDTVRLADIEIDGLTGSYGYYAQGPLGSTSGAMAGFTGSPAAGNTITVTLTDDLGNAYTTVYTLVAGDSTFSTLATHLAAAINASGAVAGQTAFLAPVTPTSTSSSATLDFTSLYGTFQANLYLLNVAVTGSITPSSTAFTGGSAESSNDFFAQRCGCKTGSTPVEAFHCDGAVSAFTTLLGSAESGCSYHTRVVTLNASSETYAANPPTFIEIQAAQSDHTVGTAFSFENGRSCRLIGSRSGATGGYSVYVGPNYGIDMRVLSCDLNKADTSIVINNGDVVVEACSIASSGTAILLESTVVSPVSLIGNQLGLPGQSSQSIAIDISGLASGTDWITIVGNTLAEGTLNLSSSSLVPLGPHSRISNNPGYNPSTPLFQPSFPPSSLALVQNPYSSDAMVVITPHGMTITAIKLRTPGGSLVTYLSGSFTGTTQIQVLVPCGSEINIAYSGSGGTWTWFPT